jgi:predicted DNA-binding WGR domain protein
MRRRYESKRDDNELFWEIERRGNNLVFTSGLVGKTPKVETKEFSTDEIAVREHRRLVTRKQSEGYQEVSVLRHHRSDDAVQAPAHQTHWSKVMCLTGVDYFSTLGYQPGIAFLAAGMLSPLATLVVVLVTLFGLVPLYSRVAQESPFGQGSIAMLERLLPGWRGKTLVLVLLGFAATDFVITITLSSADAAAHIVQLPGISAPFTDRLCVTIGLLLILCAVFLRGFREAVGLCVLVAFAYLVCNAVLMTRCLQEIAAHPQLLSIWHAGLFQSFHSLPRMIGLSLIMFPGLALGMSGFETGVSVMPLIKGKKTDDPLCPEGKIANTKKLLFSAALIMAVFLLLSSLVTTLLIPAALFQEGGEANGRALSYLAHKFFGASFGITYDITTVLILWFAGASALAGLLNLVPRYLPKYGMAPDWARSQKALVIFFAVVSCVVTVLFKANVDAQAGAYATGVLVLMTSAAFAVLLAVKRENFFTCLLFLGTFLTLMYTTAVNIYQRPEGLQIGAIFIGTILVGSLISRALRSLELRVKCVELDATANKFIDEVLAEKGRICLLARKPAGSSYTDKEKLTRAIHLITEEETKFLFLEVKLTDPSDFADDELLVTGHTEGDHRILRCSSATIPNAIAAIVLHIRDEKRVVPHVYFDWTEGHPLSYVLKYIFLGEGETAPLTREILREVDKDEARRPRVIVG